MSLALAIPLGMASAAVYGTSIVVQHDVAHRQVESDAKGLLALLRNPRWLIALGGDVVGFLLQIGALSAGSVVVVQPLVVLMLPVALVVAWLMGGPRPSRHDFLGSLGIVGGVGAFLILIGIPGDGHVPRPHYIAMTIVTVLVVGVVASLAVTGRRPMIRGAIYGAVAGSFFGTLGVMVDAASERVSTHGWHGLIASPRGVVPLIGIAVLGLGGIILTQISFQVGALGATLPASLGADPFTGVLIGVVLLREHVPLGFAHLVGYACCMGAALAGAVQLANSPTRRSAPDAADRMAL